MWESTGRWVLNYRLPLLILLTLSTAFMAWHASKVELSYEFSRAIPVDNPKFLEYQSFKSTFGEDGNLMVIGMQSEKFFSEPVFNDFIHLNQQLQQIGSVEDVLSVSSAVNLKKNDSTEKLVAQRLFGAGPLTQQEIDSSRQLFQS